MRLLVVCFTSALPAQAHTAWDSGDAIQLLAVGHSRWRTKDQQPQIEPWDCTGETGDWQTKPLHAQSTIGEDAQFVPLVNFETGESGQSFTLPLSDFSYKGTKVQAINACGLNPLDSILYCVAYVAEDGEDAIPYLVQIDQTPQMHFIGRFPEQSFAADFTSDGDFYAVTYGAENQKLYTISAELLADAVTASTASPENVDSVLDGNFLDLLDGNVPEPLDIVVLDVGDDTCAVGVTENLEKLLVVDVSTRQQAWLDVEVRTSENQVMDPKPQGKFGAAWNFENQALFAGNDGQGVFFLELNGLDLSQVPAAGTAILTFVGASDETTGDGFNCKNGNLDVVLPVEKPVEQPVQPHGEPCQS